LVREEVREDRSAAGDKRGRSMVEQARQALAKSPNQAHGRLAERY
jgi:hypothetical protein